MKKALPIVLLSTLSAALATVLVVSSTKSSYKGTTDAPDPMYLKYGDDYYALQTMEEEYDRLQNKWFLSKDEKLTLENLPIMIINQKKSMGMELTQDEIDYETDYLNSFKAAEPIEN